MLFIITFTFSEPPPGITAREESESSHRITASQRSESLHRIIALTHSEPLCTIITRAKSESPAKIPPYPISVSSTFIITINKSESRC